MLSLTSYRFQGTRHVILDGSLLCNKYQNSYVLHLYRESIFNRSKGTPIKSSKQSASRVEKASGYIHGKFGIAWGHEVGRLNRQNLYARSLDGHYTRDYWVPLLTSLTPPFIPLFVSRTRSNVVLSSLRPCRANRRTGVDIQATTMTRERGEEEGEEESERESIHPVHKHSASDTSIKRNKVLAYWSNRYRHCSREWWISSLTDPTVNPRPCFSSKRHCGANADRCKIPFVDLLDEILWRDRPPVVWFRRV